MRVKREKFIYSPICCQTFNLLLPINHSQTETLWKLQTSAFQFAIFLLNYFSNYSNKFHPKGISTFYLQMQNSWNKVQNENAFCGNVIKTCKCKSTAKYVYSQSANHNWGGNKQKPTALTEWQKVKQYFKSRVGKRAHVTGHNRIENMLTVFNAKPNQKK